MSIAATLPKDAKIDPEDHHRRGGRGGWRPSPATALLTGWQEAALGSLEPGMKADLVLDQHRPAGMGADVRSTSTSLVYTASGDSVDTTIVDGRES